MKVYDLDNDNAPVSVPGWSEGFMLGWWQFHARQGWPDPKAKLRERVQMAGKRPIFLELEHLMGQNSQPNVEAHGLQRARREVLEWLRVVNDVRELAPDNEVYLYTAPSCPFSWNLWKNFDASPHRENDYIRGFRRHVEQSVALYRGYVGLAPDLYMLPQNMSHWERAAAIMLRACGEGAVGFLSPHYVHMKTGPLEPGKLTRMVRTCHKWSCHAAVWREYKTEEDEQWRPEALRIKF
jgi:hypothetical protein